MATPRMLSFLSLTSGMLIIIKPVDNKTSGLLQETLMRINLAKSTQVRLVLRQPVKRTTIVPTDLNCVSEQLCILRFLSGSLNIELRVSSR